MTTPLYVPSVEGGLTTVGQAIDDARRQGLAGRLRLAGTLSPAEYAALQALKESRFFLVRNRNGGTGERYRCARCNARHEYFTLMCVERPFRGLDQALWGYATIRGDELIQRKLQRFGGQLQGFGGGVLTAAGDLADAHPHTFGGYRPGADEAELLAVAIGELEPIGEAKARELAQHINDRRPPTLFWL